MMEAKFVIFALFFKLAVCAEIKNEVPEPIFEVFAPKGLKVSIPDFSNIKTVEFSISVPSHPDSFHQEVRHKDGNFWVFYNPNILVNLYDKITYKILIRHGDLHCTREGTHVVLKVLPLPGHNQTQYYELEGQKAIKVQLPLKAEETKGVISGKSANYKTSFSSVKNANLKPITKTTTSTTSGTFFVKPSGVMEATGYKQGSTFDSTKREGEQWEHYRSDLTAEELENMKRIYDSGLHNFPFLTDKFFPSSSAKVYEKSYMTSESKSFPEVQKITTYGEGPVTTKFYQTHKTHETSSYGKPVFQFHSTGGESFGANRQAEQSYRLEPLTQLPHPLPPQGTIFKATEYVREEHTVPVGEVSQVHVDRETHSSSAPQKIIQVSQAGEFASHHNQEVVKPSVTHVITTSGRGDQLEHMSGNLQTVERQNYRERENKYSTHYKGSIFTTVKNKRIQNPQECSLVPGIDYTSSGSIRELEKYVYELSCLATLAESTIKDELALLKQRNGELNRKLEFLEQEVKRISATCNCYE